MRVRVIDKHGAPIPLLSLIRTLTVGPRVSLSQPHTGYVRVADYNRRFEITSTPITTDAQSTTHPQRLKIEVGAGADRPIFRPLQLLISMGSVTDFPD